MACRIAILFCGIVSLLLPESGPAQDPPVFETDIQPLLARRCAKCHSQEVRKGGLDLSTMAALRRGGESGEDVVGDSLEESLLWTRVSDGDMPPDGEPPLSEQERAVLREWFASGALSEKPHQQQPPLGQHDVIPILLLRCTTCHGPRRQEGGLDLRTRAAMLAGGTSGPALVPGDPDASLMLQRIESAACPPRELLLKFFVRRPPSAEVQTIREWIAACAPAGDVEPDVATTAPDPLVTDEDRQHWAFQPAAATAGAASIDKFVQARLHEHGLEFSPVADRDTLIRRACLDLIGMPPSLADWNRWRSSDDPQWSRQMIDELLASPHYGERWGRYWLDLAGYADSEGGVSSDPIRAVAWKYRDYVIRAFNDDKPYDRFLLEQLAGDELLDYDNAPVITDQMVENLTATGFLRMGIDQTGSRTMNFVPERIGVISDAITIVGEGLMGLTLGCARCHSHKYDPIPHRDYYRFKAIFQGAYDEHDWLTFKTRSLDIDTPQRRQRIAQINPPLQAELRRLQSQLTLSTAALHRELLLVHYPQQTDEDRDQTLRALKIADNVRTQPQRVLVEMLQRAAALPDDQQPGSVLKARREVEATEAAIVEITRQLEPSLAIRALWDRGDPSPTYVLRRGEHNKPGPLVGPGVPSVLTDGCTPFEVVPPFPEGTPRTGRRLALARWLTQPDHPLTARVMVNRIWYHHFGAGLVRSLENFGMQGDPPSHPQLLDWLAMQFVEQGWSVKQLHRLIMNSRVYQQSSRITEQQQHVDPQNRLLAHMPLRRMDAEAIRDSLLSVSGRLDATGGGPPDPVTVDRDGLVSVVPGADGRWRRSIYLQHRRTEIPTLLETFDYPEMGPNCLSRSVSTVSLQPLMLMNNRHVRQLAAALAERVARLADESDDASAAARIDLVYQLALSRAPTDHERQLGLLALDELESASAADSSAAFEAYCHTILNSAAFLYVD